MNTKLALTIAASALAFGVQQAQALTLPFDPAFQYRDADTPGVVVAPGGFANGSFNIAAGDADGSFLIAAGIYPVAQGGGTTITPAFGYTPGTPIGSMEIDLWFSHIGGDTFKVSLGDLGALPDITEPLGTHVVTQGLDILLKSDLETDGQILYSVNNVGPTFVVFNYAALGANLAPTTTPDGGATAMLLGAGLLGVSALRRKLS